MIWKIKLSAISSEKLLGLDKKDKKSAKLLKSKLNEMALHEDPCLLRFVKPLTGKLRGLFRARAGNYRAVFTLIKKEKIIAVVNIDIRRDIYK